ncbi:MAG: protein serine/threonine phosphatase 2C family protein [Gammaproteobacteria bacterium]|nr:protein serine/threonine phosphatase 2C family protein [Gammaproteobacteria bacterium]
MQLLSTGFSEIGPVRRKNEDAILDWREQGLFAVIDGMGGHKHGRMAAHTLCRALALFRRQSSIEGSVTMILRNISEANERIYQLSNGQSGATACILLLQDDMVHVLWAGDTRAYLLRNRALTQLTTDHANAHSNTVTRAIGIAPTIDMAQYSAPASSRDSYILATDGLYRAVSDERIKRVMCQYPMAAAAQMLKNRALTNGTRDNYSALFVRVG